MNISRTTSLLVLAGLPAFVGSLAHAQTSISPSNKFAWGENIGYINFRDAGSPLLSNGVRVRPSVLSGWAWSENLGWINFGSGTPINGVSYANPTSGTVLGVPEFGVNRSTTTNQLSGYAWSENGGWINFSGGALASPADPARVDTVARRLRGFAWGENIGWINLSDANVFVSLCGADFDGNGFVQLDDIFLYLAAWFANDLRADTDGNGSNGLDDIFLFLNGWFAGC